MNYSKAGQFMLDQIPRAHRALFPATLKSAYEAVELLVKTEPILQVPSAEDNRGRVISWAVDLAFSKLITSGRWPVDFRWRRFARPTGQYLEIRLSHSVMTISQVRDPKKQPRDVVFRANGRLNNQTFLGLPDFADEEAIQGLPSILLVHGHQSLQFAHLGIPNKQHEFGYLYRTPNLLTELHAVEPEPEVAPTEETDIEAVLSLKEEIERWQHDHHDE